MRTDQENAARAGRARLEDLVRVHDEVLAHDGTPSGAERGRGHPQMASISPPNCVGSVSTETAATPPLA